MAEQERHEKRSVDHDAELAALQEEGISIAALFMYANLKVFCGYLNQNVV
jgi:hypothetical protein